MNQEVLELLKEAEQHFVKMYNTIAPLGQYDKSNNFADKDEVVLKLRKKISENS